MLSCRYYAAIHVDEYILSDCTKSTWSLELCSVDVMELMGMESQ
jgi:hypothetical protein